MSMEVYNVKYNEVIKLINNMYSKYININNIADNRAPFIKETLKNINKKDIKDVDFGKISNNYNIDNTSFTKLINEIIYCNLGNIDVSNIIIDNTHRTKGYLKFVKSDTSQVARTVKTTKNDDIIKNILSSMHLVNVFIDILEAYKSFLDNTDNLEHLKKNVNNIFIVNKKSKKSTDITNLSDNNYGYWIDSAVGENVPNLSSLYLSIKSYDYTNTNQLFTDFIVNYDAVNKSVSSSSQTSEIGANSSGLFVLKANKLEINDRLNNSSNIIRGIVIQYEDGRPIIKKKGKESIVLSEFNNIKITNSSLETALLERNRRLLIQFLNLIINFDLINRETQINGLLTYFKVIKEYFYISLTSGNLLFNSYYKKLNMSQATPAASDITNIGNNGDGFAIKYLSNDEIKDRIYEIYESTFTTDNIKIPNPSSSNIIEKSFFAGAKKENDDNYMNKIIENLSKLQNSGAQSANISNTTQQYISEKGFVAIIEDNTTIKIKSRISLIRNLLDELLSNTNNDLKTNTNISEPDGLLIHGDTLSTDTSFKFSNLKNSNLPINVKNYISNLDSNNLSKNYIISINNTSFPIKKILATNNNEDVEFLISGRLIYPTDNTEDLKDIPVLNLPYNKVTLFNEDNTYRGETNQSPDRFFNSLDEAKGKSILFHNLNQNNLSQGVDNKVKITIKKPLDYKSGYVSNLEAIKNINNNINSNESRIKNDKTLYYLNKSKYYILYYQLISYIVILACIIVALILTNTMKMDKPVTKLIASVCFGIVVLLFVTYYITSVLYVETFTSNNVIEKFSQEYKLPDIVNQETMEFTSVGNYKYPEQKVEFVQNQIILFNNKIINALELANVGVGQANSSDAYTKLLNITELERSSRYNINNILQIQSDSSKLHIDLIKYNTIVHTVNIKTVLMLSLAIVVLFTINVYTDGKYMENLAFVGVFILIIILAYYLIYSNSVVRTRSNNVYWGKVNENNYNI